MSVILKFLLVLAGVFLCIFGLSACVSAVVMRDDAWLGFLGFGVFLFALGVWIIVRAKKIGENDYYDEPENTGAETWIANNQWVGLVVLVVVVGGLFSLTTGTSKTESRQNAAFVQKSDYGARWPYTINSGYLRCENSVKGGFVKQLAYIESGGKKYALNGSAISSGKFIPLEKIWRSNPSVSGSKIPDPGIIGKALSFCQ